MPLTIALAFACSARKHFESIILWNIIFSATESWWHFPAASHDLIYNMCFKNMPGLTIQCLLKTWKHEWKRVWKLHKHTSLMYSLALRVILKSRPPWSQIAESRWKLTELCFHFSIGSVSKRQRWGHFEEAQAGDQHKPVLCLHWQTPLYVTSPTSSGEETSPWNNGKDIFLNIRNTGQHELSTQTVLRAMCLSCMSPRCWGGVYWWHCLPFHIHNSSQIKSAPSSWTLQSPDGQTIYFMQKNQEHGWRDRTFWVCHLLWRKCFHLIRLNLSLSSVVKQIIHEFSLVSSITFYAALSYLPRIK